MPFQGEFTRSLRFIPWWSGRGCPPQLHRASWASPSRQSRMLSCSAAPPASTPTVNPPAAAQSGGHGPGVTRGQAVSKGPSLSAARVSQGPRASSGTSPSSGTSAFTIHLLLAASSASHPNNQLPKLYAPRHRAPSRMGPERGDAIWCMRYLQLPPISCFGQSWPLLLPPSTG